MELKEVDISELERLVRIGFEGDKALLQNQQLNTEMEVTIRRNIDNIITESSELNLRYFEVVENDILVGFTVADIGKNLLLSFGINVKHRTKELVIAWFNELKKLFDNEFCTVLHSVNKRAINFMKRNGMVIQEQNNLTTVLVYYEPKNNLAWL